MGLHDALVHALQPPPHPPHPVPPAPSSPPPPSPPAGGSTTTLPPSTSISGTTALVKGSITELRDALPPETSIARPAPKSWKAKTFPQSRPSRPTAASPTRSASYHSRSPVAGSALRST